MRKKEGESKSTCPVDLAQFTSLVAKFRRNCYLKSYDVKAYYLKVSSSKNVLSEVLRALSENSTSVEKCNEKCHCDVIFA